MTWKKKTISIVAAVIAMSGFLSGESNDSAMMIEKRVKSLQEDRRKLMARNPKVVYADENNPLMNVKTTMRTDKYHRGTLTVINRKFYCPIHHSRKMLYSAWWSLEMV